MSYCWHKNRPSQKFRTQIFFQDTTKISAKIQDVFKKSGKSGQVGALHSSWLPPLFLTIPGTIPCYAHTLPYYSQRSSWLLPLFFTIPSTLPGTLPYYSKRSSLAPPTIPNKFINRGAHRSLYIHERKIATISVYEARNSSMMIATVRFCEFVKQNRVVDQWDWGLVV